VSFSVTPPSPLLCLWLPLSLLSKHFFLFLYIFLSLCFHYFSLSLSPVFPFPLSFLSNIDRFLSLFPDYLSCYFYFPLSPFLNLSFYLCLSLSLFPDYLLLYLYLFPSHCSDYPIFFLFLSLLSIYLLPLSLCPDCLSKTISTTSLSLLQRGVSSLQLNL
jgi:hypothetical protein